MLDNNYSIVIAEKDDFNEIFSINMCPKGRKEVHDFKLIKVLTMVLEKILQRLFGHRIKRMV